MAFLSRFFLEPEPPEWKSFLDTAQHVGLALFGFVEDWKLLYRFKARYRLAHVCEGIKTRGYGPTTARGYDALTRMLLSWSLLELYLKLASIKGPTAVGALLDAHGAQELLDNIRGVTGHEKFFKAIHENLDRPKHREAVERFLAGKACDRGQVLASVRHVFAHGYLTPSGGGIEAMDATTICTALADFLLRLVDAAWKEKVDSGFADLYAS